MCIIGNEMIVCVFYKRIVYKCTLGTPHLVTCNHCGVQLSRGSTTAPKEKWHNKIMDNHLKRVHPDIMKEVCEARGNKGEKVKDLRDETARGLFQSLICAIGKRRMPSYHRLDIKTEIGQP